MGLNFKLTFLQMVLVVYTVFVCICYLKAAIKMILPWLDVMVASFLICILRFYYLNN